MKKIIIKTLCIAAILIGSKSASAQMEAASFIRAGKQDASKLVGAYLQPVTKGLASGVNDAWYSTAKPLGLFGFDIRVGIGASIIRDDSKSYTLNGIGLNSDPKSEFLLTPIGGDRNTKQPTIAGEGSGTRFAVSALNPLNTSQRIYIDTISSFSGTNSPVSLGAIPFVQLSLGLVKGTEIMFRMMPIQSGDFTSSGFGFGVKHSISQWIWGVDKLPIDISGIYTFNNSSLEYAFGNNFLDADRNIPEAKSVNEYKNSQKLAITTSGHQFGAIISKKLSVFTPYLGVTFNSATSQIAMKGIYPIQSVRKSGLLYEEFNDNVTDPVSFSNTVNSTRASLGFRIKMLPFTFGAEYNHSFSADQFNTFNATFAINIQQLAPIPKL
ncbi:MAG: DUF6588 family protein [Bacteroidia bacterium]